MSELSVFLVTVRRPEIILGHNPVCRLSRMLRQWIDGLHFIRLGCCIRQVVTVRAVLRCVRTREWRVRRRTMSISLLILWGMMC